MPPTHLVQGRYSSRGRFISDFQGDKEGQSILLVLVASQGLLIQNNQYASAACFGVTYSEPAMIQGGSQS